MTRILAIANQKGGVGKTTTTINLGASLHKLNQHILLVDLDAQGHTSSGLGFRKTPPHPGIGSIFQTRQKIQTIQPVSSVSPFLFDIIPASESSEADAESLKANPELLRDVLHNLPQYDYIILDTPPALNHINYSAMLAATGCIIPLQAEFFAFESLNRLLLFIQTARQLNQTLSLDGILMTMYTNSARHCEEIVKQAEPLLGWNSLFNTIIPRDIQISEAQSHRKTILDYAPASPVSKAYLHTARELLVRHFKLPSLDAEPPERSGQIASDGILEFDNNLIEWGEKKKNV